MSLLSKTPTTPSKSEKLAKLVSTIGDVSSNTYSQLVSIQNMGINLLWHSKEFTPQEVIDGLGDNALKVFQFHGALTDLIVALAALDGIAPEVKLPTNAFSVVDGSIVVSSDPYTIN